jgi:hypothetical protein
MATPRRDWTAGVDQQVVTGIETHLDPNMVLHLNGKAYTAAELAKFIRKRARLAHRIEKAKALWLSLIEQYAAHDAELNLVLKEFRVQVFGIFGRESPKVKEFSFKPPKKRTMTVEAKKAAAEKARATRIARGTKGRKARLAIKGAVPDTPAAADAPPKPDDPGSEEPKK